MTPSHPRLAARQTSLIENLEPRRLMAFADAVPSWGDGGVGIEARLFSEQADGRILGAAAGGDTDNLVRFNADGSFDTRFSKDGKVPFGATLVAARQITGGKIIVAYTYRKRLPGQSDSVYTPDDIYKNGYGIARFTANGALDTTFANNGYSAEAFRSDKIGQYAEIGGVAIDADGSTYFGVSGDYLSVLSRLETFTSFVLKFNAQGRRDQAYGDAGIATLPSRLQIGDRGDFARTIDSLEITDGGAVLIAGSELRFDNKQVTTAYNESVRTGVSSFVTRLTAGGRDDTRFATAGTFKIDQADTVNPNGGGESAKVIDADNGNVLLVTRVNERLRVFTLTARGQSIAALNAPPADAIANPRSYIQFADELPNGNLIVSAYGVLFELRKTNVGYVAQAPRVPTDAAGRPLHFSIANGNTLLPLRDGDVLLGSPHGFTTKFETGDGQTPRADDQPFGRQNSITTPNVSDTDIPRLDAFYRSAQGGLYYRQRATDGRWGRPQLVDPSADAGFYLSSFGTSVVYNDGTGKLKFAKRLSNGKFRIETVDSGKGVRGYYPSLVATSATTLAVAYYEQSEGDLRLARRSATGVWTVERVDRRGDRGRFPKLVVRPEGGLSIAYAVTTGGGVRLAEQKAGATVGRWTFTDLATTGVDVAGLDLDYFLTNNDPEPSGPSELTTTVAIYENTSKDLIVAYRATAASRFKLIREKTKGNVGQNPHVSHYEPGTVSFYDVGRNRVLTTRIVDVSGRFSLATDALPTIASAGEFANPVVSYETADIRNGYAGGGYTSIYAWVDADGVLKIRGPV